MKKSLLALVLCVALTACASEPAPPPAPLDYASLGKIYLDTQDLRVVNRFFDSTAKTSSAQQAYTPKLSEAIKRWASDRLQPVGTVGHATILIKDASVSEQILPTSSSFENWFTRQQSSKLIGRIEVEIDAQSPMGDVGSKSGFAKAHASHSVTLPQDPTEKERASAYKTLLDALMANLNKNLEQAIREHMARFVVTQPPESGAMLAPPAAPALAPVVSPATQGNENVLLTPPVLMPPKAPAPAVSTPATSQPLSLVPNKASDPATPAR